MARETVLGGVLDIMERLGVYDVILPFLLTFTVVFAILEKTRVLGVEKINGEPYPKKSLNAMVAFCIGFFVIASAQLVAVVTQVSAEMVVVILMGVFFLMMVGTFYAPGEVEKNIKDTWATYFGYIFFFAILIMFARAIPYSSNQSMLDYGLSFVGSAANSSAVAAFILIGIILFLMWFVTAESSDSKPKKPKGE